MGKPAEPSTHLGAAIRDAREAMDWPRQAQLAEALASIGYERSQDTISRWERGERVPTPDELIALGIVLHRPTELYEALRADGEALASERMAAASTVSAMPRYLYRLILTAFPALSPSRSVAHA